MTCTYFWTGLCVFQCYCIEVNLCNPSLLLSLASVGLFLIRHVSLCVAGARGGEPHPAPGVEAARDRVGPPHGHDRRPADHPARPQRGGQGAQAQVEAGQSVCSVSWVMKDRAPSGSWYRWETRLLECMGTGKWELSIHLNIGELFNG